VVSAVLAGRRHVAVIAAASALSVLVLASCSDSPGLGAGPDATGDAAGPTESGRRIVLTIDEGQDADRARIDDTVAVLRRRLDALGVKEAQVQADTDQIVATVPSSAAVDSDAMLTALTSRAALEFRKVLEVAFPGTPQFQRLAGACDAAVVPLAGEVDQEVVRCESAAPGSSEGDGSESGAVYRLGPAEIGNDDIADAHASPDANGPNQVEIDLTHDGAKAFQRVTGELACEDVASPTRQFAIVLDGAVVSAPTIAEEVRCDVGITGGRAIITTGGDAGEAEALAVALRAGALPLAVSVAMTP
jgi:preprotein translocase subunit SecD